MGRGHAHDRNSHTTAPSFSICWLRAVLTLILGVVALVLLQRAILRNMMRAGEHGFMPPADEPPAPARRRQPGLRRRASRGRQPASRAACCGAMPSPTPSPDLAFAAVADRAALALQRHGVRSAAADRGGHLGLSPGRRCWCSACWSERDRRVQALIVLGYLGVLAHHLRHRGVRGTPAPARWPASRFPAFPARRHLALIYAAPSVYPAAVPQPHDPVDRPAGAAVRVRAAARQPHRD